MAKNPQGTNRYIQFRKILCAAISWRPLLLPNEHRTPASKVSEFITLNLIQATDLILPLYQISIYYKQKSLEDEPTVFLDPNGMSADGTVAITSLVFSGDAKMVAYTYNKAGSDWNKLNIRNVETGEDYPETLEGLKFSYTSWTNDNKGFFYNVSTLLKIVP